MRVASLIPLYIFQLTRVHHGCRHPEFRREFLSIKLIYEFTETFLAKLSVDIARVENKANITVGGIMVYHMITNMVINMMLPLYDQIWRYKIFCVVSLQNNQV